MRTSSTGKAAIGLGWLSIGLGLSELLAPRALTRALGVRQRGRVRPLLRAMGARELAAGIGLLAQPRRSARWLWARVAGDAIDLGLLGAALASPRTKRGRVLGALGAVAGVTALDVLAAMRASREQGTLAAEPVRRSVTIARDPAEVYAFWRDVRNLPRFMLGLESVTPLDARSSRWRARGPVGPVVEWETVIVEDLDNHLIRWRSKDDSRVKTDGVVRFVPAPGGRGTEVHLEVMYQPASGLLGRAIAALSDGVMGTKVEADLSRCKQLLEIGQIAHSDASLHLGPHPARPSTKVEVPL
jgi:uncharacterized membrane protein